MSSQENSNKLLNRLLDCVKECQKRYGGKTELATEFDTCVYCLCNTLEAVFLHGLKTKPIESSTKQVKQVSDIVEIVANTLSLNNDNTSYWPFIKKHLTVHEKERYDALKHIWTDTGRGKAWIRSTLNERSLERYFHILLGNNKILNIYYESWALLCDDENNNLLPNMAAGLGAILFAISIDKPEFNASNVNKAEKPKVEPIIVAPIVDIKCNKELKKKRKVATIISFDDDNDSILSSSIPSSTGDYFYAGNHYTNQNSDKKDKRHLVITKTNLKDMEEEEARSISSAGTSDTQSSTSSTELQCEQPHRGIVRKLSIETSGSRDKYPTKLEGTLTPLEPNIGELTPISVECGGNTSSTNSNDVDVGVEVSADVSAILTVVEAKNLEETTKLNDKVNLLTKENENLKDQLQKYMGAVQLLKSQDADDDDVESPDYKSEAKLFERKLVQVAEMHAELMDFNVVLQQALCQKETQVEKLKGELSELRGPLASDDLDDETHCCVNVWIPSAFLTGAGSEAHHVYQIFLRAGSDEWNIYRRYAQFHALHSDLKKLDHAVSAFDFPPKKSLGNKDSQLVEDRRKRLQKYLRRILSHWPELSQCNSRFLLEQHLAFFKEQKDPKKRGLFSSRRSAPASGESHYTGL